MTILEEAAAAVGAVQRGQRWYARCMFHVEHEPSMLLDGQDNHYHCFGCGAHGPLRALLPNYVPMPRPTPSTPQDPLPWSVEALAREREVWAVATAYAQAHRDTDGVRLRDLLAAAMPAEAFRACQASLAPQQLPVTDPAELAIIDHRPGVSTMRPKVPLAAVSALDALLQTAALPAVGDDLCAGYLADRGFAMITAVRFGVAILPESHLRRCITRIGHPDFIAALCALGVIGPVNHYRFANRLLLPITTARGTLVGMAGRALRATQKPKYLNTHFAKSHYWYGLAQALDAPGAWRELVVVEGYTDVWRLVDRGMPRAVAAMGTSVSDTQARQLRGIPRVVCCFDGDEPGRKAMLATVPTWLRAGVWPLALWLDSGDDPDTAWRHTPFPGTAAARPLAPEWAQQTSPQARRDLLAGVMAEDPWLARVLASWLSVPLQMPSRRAGFALKPVAPSVGAVS